MEYLHQECRLQVTVYLRLLGSGCHHHQVTVYPHLLDSGCHHQVMESPLLLDSECRLDMECLHLDLSLVTCLLQECQEDLRIKVIMGTIVTILISFSLDGLITLKTLTGTMDMSLIFRPAMQCQE